MKIPYLSGDYVHVYRPEAAVFRGPDSTHFRSGQRYEEWVPNDFTIVHDGARWHLIGITHPCPEWFTGVDADQPGAGDIHEAEWQLFHAVSIGSLKDSLMPGGFRQTEQVLSATERVNERPEIWAPICWKKDEEFVMLYSPDPIRRAVSRDLNRWELRGTAFVCGDDFARDPNIMEEDGVYTVVYIQGNTLYTRKSRDLECFSEPEVLFEGPEGVALESPVLKRIDGWYYLFYCIFDGRDRINGSYDYRTYVHASRTLEGLNGSPRAAAVRAHAPEVFQDECGQWYIASIEWPNRGVSIAPLGWKEYDPDEPLEF